MARQSFPSSSVRSGKPSTACKCSRQYENHAQHQHAASQKRCCKVRVKAADLKDPELKALFFGPASMECVQAAVLVSYYEFMHRMNPIQAQWLTLHSGQYAFEPAVHQPTTAAVQTLQHSSISTPPKGTQMATKKTKIAGKPIHCHNSTNLAQHQQTAAVSCPKMTTNSSSTALLSEQVVTQEVMAPAQPFSNISIDLAKPQQPAADSCTLKTINSSDKAAHQQLTQHAEPLSPPLSSQNINLQVANEVNHIKEAATKALDSSSNTACQQPQHTELLSPPLASQNKLQTTIEPANHTKQASHKMSLISTIVSLAQSFISWVDFDIEIELSFNSWY